MAKIASSLLMAADSMAWVNENATLVGVAVGGVEPVEHKAVESARVHAAFHDHSKVAYA